MRDKEMWSRRDAGEMALSLPRTAGNEPMITSNGPEVVNVLRARSSRPMSYNARDVSLNDKILNRNDSQIGLNAPASSVCIEFESRCDSGSHRVDSLAAESFQAAIRDHGPLDGFDISKAPALNCPEVPIVWREFLNTLGSFRNGTGEKVTPPGNISSPLSIHEFLQKESHSSA
jgi:hypothetical protein